jgi:protein gp37
VELHQHHRNLELGLEVLVNLLASAVLLFLTQVVEVVQDHRPQQGQQVLVEQVEQLVVILEDLDLLELLIEVVVAVEDPQLEQLVDQE